jgi:hypothetical protein
MGPTKGNATLSLRIIGWMGLARGILGSYNLSPPLHYENEGAE